MCCKQVDRGRNDPPPTPREKRHSINWWCVVCVLNMIGMVFGGCHTQIFRTETSVGMYCSLSRQQRQGPKEKRKMLFPNLGSREKTRTVQQCSSR